MLISVVVPAFNEGHYLPRTLAMLADAARECPHPVELIVVDNASTDDTAMVAASLGAKVVEERVHNIARVRNTGASVARGEIIVFVDADTAVPPRFLARISEAVADPKVLGGAAVVVQSPDSCGLRFYLAGWRLLGRVFGLAQGAAQFCRRSIFDRLGGYDESRFMGEDVDFYDRLSKLSRSLTAKLEFLDDVPVHPSERRFNQWPLWRTLIWTNPLFIAICRKNQTAWRDWYVRAPR